MDRTNVTDGHTDGALPIDPASMRYRALVKASFLAIAVDIFLILLKAILAKITGSAVLSADAWHSAGDFAVSLTVLISIVANQKFPTRAWARNAEGLVALLISLILILGSMNVISGVFRGEAARFILVSDIPLVIAILGISIACGVTFMMFRFKRGVGEKHDSIAFSAESYHTFSDFFTSFGVLLTLFVGYFGIHVEKIMTFIVGLVVLRIGILIFLRALRFFNIPVKTEFDLTKLSPVRFRKRAISQWNNLKNLYRKYKSWEKNTGTSFEELILKRWRGIIRFQTVLILLLYIGTGFYIVLPYRTGVELLFGKVTELTPPGLHFHIPKPIGDLILADTGVMARVESGYRTNWDYEGQEPEAYLWEFTHRRGRIVKVRDEAITITGDENLVDVNFLCFYRIVDPVEYAFNCSNSHELLRNLFCYEIHALLGKYHLDTLLTTGRKMIQEQLTDKIKLSAELMPIGVEVLRVYMEEAHPPLEVVPQYRSVASARERKDEIIHKANAYKNDLLPRSRGKAKASILESRGYAGEKTTVADGEANNFLLKQRHFNRFKQTQKDRLWWKTVEKALTGKSIYILPEEARRRIFTSDIKQGAGE